MVDETLLAQLRGHGFPSETGGGPLYLQLADALRDLIANRQLASGKALPPERELAEGLTVGRITVRNAYRELMRTGEVEVRRGSGTFVSSAIPHIEQPLWRLTSFSEDMRGRGLEPSTRVVRRAETPPTPEEVLLFGVSAREKMLRLDRLRIVDGMPVALERAVVPLHLVGEELDGRGSLYEALARRGHKPIRATQRFTSVGFEAADADMLGVEPNAPCLLIDRVSRAADGRVVEFTRSHYRGDAYDFVAELTVGD